MPAFSRTGITWLPKLLWIGLIQPILLSEPVKSPQGIAESFLGTCSLFCLRTNRSQWWSQDTCTWGAVRDPVPRYLHEAVSKCGCILVRRQQLWSPTRRSDRHTHSGIRSKQVWETKGLGILTALGPEWTRTTNTVFFKIKNTMAGVEKQQWWGGRCHRSDERNMARVGLWRPVLELASSYSQGVVGMTLLGSADRAWGLSRPLY